MHPAGRVRSADAQDRGRHEGQASASRWRSRRASPPARRPGETRPRRRRHPPTTPTPRPTAPIPARRPRWSARRSTTARAGGSTTAPCCFADGKVVAVGGPELAIPAGYDAHRRQRQVRHPGRDRHPLAPRRLPHALGRGARGRQRGDRPDHARGLGRAFGLAAGPGLHPRAGQRRGDHAADPARLGQPDGRALGHAQERARAHGAGDEVPRRALCA